MYANVAFNAALYFVYECDVFDTVSVSGLIGWVLNYKLHILQRNFIYTVKLS